MANKTISMSKVRSIIKLYSQGIGKKNIAERLSISKNKEKLKLINFQLLSILSIDCMLMIKDLQKSNDNPC